jgi:RNA polymerase sigma factor (sigma-70 family)
MGTLNKLIRLAEAATDRDLLGQLTGENGEAAFAELIRRHGSGVLGVCRRVLGHEQDAEDAFQATFMILARKASSLRRSESLGAWLFSVARHVALRLKDKDRRRKRHEGNAFRPEAVVSDFEGEEHLAVLDEEIERLPERYRTPLVACHLGGRTQVDAARELGWSLITLRRRLERGLELLRTRLSRRGISAGALAVTGVTVPQALAGATGRLAVGFMNGDRGSIPATLAEGVLAMMTRTKWAKAAILLLTLSGTAWLWQAASGGMPATAAQKLEPQKNDPQPAPKIDLPEPKIEPKTAPLARPAPELIRPGDQLRVLAIDDFETSPLGGVYVVERGGTVALGPRYGGRVKVEGLTLDQAEAALQKQARAYAKRVEVTVTFAAITSEQESKLERRVQQLEQEVLELRAAIRELQKRK